MADEIDNFEETQQLPREGSEENVETEKDLSFQNSFEKRMNEILSEPVAKKTKKVAKKKVATPVEDVEEPSLDYNSLFEDVYGSVFDSEKDQDKMKSLRSIIDKDPRLKQMAMESPEKFALFFYRLV